MIDLLAVLIHCLIMCLVIDFDLISIVEVERIIGSLSTVVYLLHLQKQAIRQTRVMVVKLP